MKTGISVITIALVGLLLAAPAKAELLVDRGQQVAGLWVFPEQDDPSRFKYLPEKARVSTNDDNEPLFSFTFFVDEQPAAVEDGPAIRSISEASGGGILHVLLEYGTAPEVIAAAQTELRQLLEDDEAVIVGPVALDSGTFSVISSVLTSDGARSATMLAQRPAPVFEGQRIALSYELSPRLANILIATMKTDTPDLTVTFDLLFHGLSDTYDAYMEVDWEKTAESLQAGGGIDIYVVSLEAEAAIEKAVTDGAIRLVVNGDDSAMESIVQLAYEKALEMIYSPIEFDQIPDDEKGGMMDALGVMLDNQLGSAAGSALGFGLSASYRMKDLRSEGVSRLSFSKAATVKRTAMLSVNLGDLYQRYGNDERFVRIESTGDCAFEQRRVFVLVDGALRPEFGTFVNYVGVTLRKSHDSGEPTIRQLIVDASNADVGDTLGPLTYNSNGDDCDEDWLKFDYQTDWNFLGGGSYTAPWTTTGMPSIGLDAPYHRQEIFVEGDLSSLAAADVRAVVVEVTSDFFGERKSQRRTFRPGSTTGPIEPFLLVQPEGHYEYDYQVTWLMSGGVHRRAAGRDDLSFIFVDEVPE